jgi:hypothetical protein
MNTTRRTILYGLLTLLLGLLMGCGTTSVVTEPNADAGGGEPAATQPQASVGDAITLSADDGTSIDLTVVATKRVSKAVSYGTELHPALFAVKLTIANNGTTVYDECVANCAVLIDTDDQSVEPESMVVDANLKTLPGAMDVSDLKVRPGDRRTGWVFFAFPRASKARSFQYTPQSGWSDTMAEWSLR